MLGQQKRAVGIFPRFEQMAEALDRLKVSGFGNCFDSLTVAS
ncbi:MULTISPECIES: hypothetical protein [Oscillatoriales]|nr:MULTISPECIES: hypothetical protein [Oscillatoriales]